MDWPLASNYTAILQNPKVAFVDPQLQACQIRRNAHNQPLGISGQFAVVYQAELPDGRRRAVRAFTSPREERTERYQLISELLAQNEHIASLVEFQYTERGLRAATNSGRARLYPLITMEWVAGDTLFDWVRDRCRANEQDRMRELADRWVQLVSDLEAAQIAHGDLQHGNVLVTPQDELKLVDYDGMCVPSLVGRRNLEIGMPPYQHPRRSDQTLLSLTLDRFSALFIYVALRALAVAPDLWFSCVEATGYDKLLFSESDFAHPSGSEICHALQSSSDEELARLTGLLIDAYHGAMDAVPRLAEVVESMTTSAPPAMPQPAADTTWPAPDTSQPAADTTWPAPDTSQPAPETAWGAPDTSQPAPDTPWGVPDSSQPVADTQWGAPGTSQPAADTPWGAPDLTQPTTDTSWGASPSPHPSTPDAPVAGQFSTSPPTPEVPVSPGPEARAPHPPAERCDEPVPKVAPMLAALRDKNVDKFCENFDARLVRAHQDQFVLYRQLVVAWARDRFRSPNRIGLRPSRGRESVVPVPGGNGSSQVNWMWPDPRISDTCVVGLSRKDAAANESPDDISLEMRRTVTRGNYEAGRGVIIHSDRSTAGCNVVVWASIDLGFESLYSEPLTLGRLRRRSGRR
jgi:hypothetical protein